MRIFVDCLEFTSYWQKPHIAPCFNNKSRSRVFSLQAPSGTFPLIQVYHSWLAILISMPQCSVLLRIRTSFGIRFLPPHERKVNNSLDKRCRDQEILFTMGDENVPNSYLKVEVGGKRIVFLSSVIKEKVGPKD